ncbi:MAG: LacI family transcriptional regulator [Spirochaetia bacterium]|nr:LacI family transcriptional regulator [Spirochaetia bacterium]
MKVTIKDIARKTGYSINTVARALHNKADVRPETTALIQAAAKEMGYVANALAGSLRSSKRHIIGVLLSADSSNPVFAEMIQGIETKARSLGYSIILINTEQDAQKQQTGIDILLSQQVDGMIIMPIADSGISNDLFLDLPCPFIFLGRNINGLESHSVMFDDRMGAHTAAMFFLERQIEKILFLGGPAHFCSSIDRRVGFLDAYTQREIPLDETLCFPTDGHMQSGYDAVHVALRQKLHFNAIITHNDLVAYGAMRALHDNHITVPEDVQIIGYDNLEISRFIYPRLTSIDTPRLTLGSMAAEELIHHIQDGAYEYKNILLKPQLIIGESTVNA